MYCLQKGGTFAGKMHSYSPENMSVKENFVCSVKYFASWIWHFLFKIECNKDLFVFGKLIEI